MIKINHVSKGYVTGDSYIKVLENISFSVQEGEWLSILGPSGSGKSTLLHLIGGMDIPDHGDIQINSLSTSSLSIKARQKFRRDEIGFIFQDFRLLPQYNIIDNVCLPQLPYQSKSKVLEKAMLLIESLGLSHRLTHLPEALSGGEKQRVAIARAMINTPKIIVCDEPTGNLDQENRDRILDILLELQNNNHTIVMATHDLEVAKKGTSILSIRDGVMNAEVLL